MKVWWKHLLTSIVVFFPFFFFRWLRCLSPSWRSKKGVWHGPHYHCMYPWVLSVCLSTPCASSIWLVFRSHRYKLRFPSVIYTHTDLISHNILKNWHEWYDRYHPQPPPPQAPIPTSTHPKVVLSTRGPFERLFCSLHKYINRRRRQQGFQVAADHTDTHCLLTRPGRLSWCFKRW